MIKTKKSFCRFCHTYCGIEVDVENNRILKIRGDADNAASEGYTCMMGRAELERIYHPDRLLSSKKRMDNVWNDIPAEKALDEIALKLKEIIGKYGPRSVAVYCGCGAHRASAGGPWLASQFLGAIGSPSLYTVFTIDSPGMLVAWTRLFGGPVPVNLFDISNADVGMFVGVNPLESHFQSMPPSNPFKRLKDAQKNGMKLIVIDPRRSYIAKQADIHLQVKPGEDAALLSGIIKIIIEKKIYDKEYVDNNVSGITELYNAVKHFDIEYVSTRTQVPSNMILNTALMFASAKRGAAVSGTGLHMSRHQNLNSQLVMTLNAICGRYDKPGGMVRNEGPHGVWIPEGMIPVPMALYTGEKSRVREIKGTMSWLGFYPEMPSGCLTDEILTAGEGRIRALIVHGGNPALVLPDEESTVKALKDLELLVVNDHFMTATAKFAHYVIAVKHPFERADIPKMMDVSYPFPFSQYAEPLVDAPEGVIEDWEFFWGLAKRMNLSLKNRGLNQLLSGGLKGLIGMMKVIRIMMKSRGMGWMINNMKGISGIKMDKKPSVDDLLKVMLQPMMPMIPLEEVRKYPGGHVWGKKELKSGGVIPNMIGNDDRKMAAGHPEVISEIGEVLSEPVIQGGGYETGEKFGFRLITYRMKEVYGTQGHNLPSLKAKRPFNPLLMNAEAIKNLGIKDGGRVIVDSGFGKVECIVESTDDLKSDVVALAFGWGDPSDSRDVSEKGSNVQRLIPDDYRYDKVTGLALLTAIPVNVYKK